MVKSIIDIGVNDGAFKRFYDLFNKYREKLSATKADWQKIAEAQQKMSRLGKNTIQYFEEQQKAEKKLEVSEKNQLNTVRNTERSWANITKSIRSASSLLISTTRSILSWTGLGGLAGGLGLFGLDHLASVVSQGRKSALGLGVSYGQQRSFEINYGRVVGNPSGFLGNVNNALTSYEGRGSLYAAGFTESELRGKNTAEIAEALIGKLKSRVDQTPEAGLSTLAQILGGLGGSAEDLKRLRNLSRGELSQVQAQYRQNIPGLDLQGETQKKWQDFLNSLDLATNKIENSFIGALTPLVPKIAELSDKFSKAIQDFSESGKLKKWIDKLASGVGEFSKYVSSDEFKTDVRAFADNVSRLASGAQRLADLFGGGTLQKAKEAGEIGGFATAGGIVGGPLGAAAGAGIGALDVAGRRYQAYANATTPQNIKRKQQLIRKYGGWTAAAAAEYQAEQGVKIPYALDRHNPGNLRSWGDYPTVGGFAAFPSDEIGIQKIAAQLKRYQGRGNDTIAGMISTYAPSSENNTAAYIKNVATSLGIDPAQHIDVRGNNELLAKLVSAITK